MSALVLALALAATPVSHSKLGVVVLGEDATSRALLAACPALVVFPVPANPFVSAQLAARSEEHTSELQSRRDLVCRLLLEKKKKKKMKTKHKKKKKKKKKKKNKKNK